MLQARSGLQDSTQAGSNSGSGRACREVAVTAVGMEHAVAEMVGTAIEDTELVAAGRAGLYWHSPFTAPAAANYVQQGMVAPDSVHALPLASPISKFPSPLENLLPRGKESWREFRQPLTSHSCLSNSYRTIERDGRDFRKSNPLLNTAVYKMSYKSVLLAQQCSTFSSRGLGGQSGCVEGQRPNPAVPRKGAWARPIEERRYD